MSHGHRHGTGTDPRHETGTDPRHRTGMGQGTGTVPRHGTGTSHDMVPRRRNGMIRDIVHGMGKTWLRTTSRERS